MKTLKEISKILSSSYLNSFDKNKDHVVAKKDAINEVQKADVRCYNPIVISEFMKSMDKAYQENLIN